MPTSTKGNKIRYSSFLLPFESANIRMQNTIGRIIFSYKIRTFKSAGFTNSGSHFTKH